MNYITARDWFKTTATKLKVIGHTDDAPRFFHNSDHFKAEARNNKKAVWYLVLDEPRGTISGQHNSNIRDSNRFGFWILCYVEKNDWANEDSIYDQAKTIGLKVMGKAYYERLNQSGAFKLIDIDSLNYMKAGPELVNYFGAYFSFEVSDNANAQLAYDTDDWYE